MMPTSDRFRLVAALRVAAREAERSGGNVTVVDATEDSIRTMVRMAPRSARIVADELERRWSS